MDNAPHHTVGVDKVFEGTHNQVEQLIIQPSWLASGPTRRHFEEGEGSCINSDGTDTEMESSDDEIDGLQPLEENTDDNQH